MLETLRSLCEYIVVNVDNDDDNNDFIIVIIIISSSTIVFSVRPVAVENKKLAWCVTPIINSFEKVKPKHADYRKHTNSMKRLLKLNYFISYTLQESKL